MENNSNMISDIAHAFSAGGIWMWAILAVQIVAIAIVVERVIALYVTRKMNQNRFARKFEDEIRRGNINNVIKKAQKYSMLNPLSHVILAGAESAKDFGGREEIQAKMDQVLLDENSKLERRTGFLAMLGNVGTLLGLLGTIVGLIQAFGSVANVNPVEKAALLTEGISLAMNTTAYGLIMAIPTLIMYAVLQNRSQRLSEDLNQGALYVYNLLTFNYESVAKKSTRSRAVSQR